jgi:class 3 adenylate cyclase
MVADDNPDSRQLIKDIVMAMGHDVIAAVDGPGALSMAQANMPDLLILDVNMPGMTGFDVCYTLKSDEKTNSIPILMLTALSDVEHRIHGLDQGADDYLGKPFNPRELMARVETRLRAKSESDDMRETQQMIRKTFERFVSPSVVEQLLRDPSLVKLGGKLQEVTVMFADMEGFTAMSEKIHPEILLSVLNQYHSLIVSMIQQHHGTVDKFIGDGVMVLFNTPLPQPKHVTYAVETALAVREALAEFHQHLEPIHRMGINFGIHTGMAVVGNVGTADIMDFTAVGDTVNVASRLQGLCNNSQILVSSQVYEQVKDQVIANPMGPTRVKNRTEAVMTYEILDWSEPG